jgi:NADH:quinone reductase (non-electrogenic)
MAGRKLLVLGGGFGGLDVARAIGRSRVARSYWDTLLIDKENFFQFNPLLPAVAVGSVETRHIVYPFRDMARHRQIRFHKNKVIAIDLDRRVVRLHNDLTESYDTLVIALGSVTADYGVPGVAEYTRVFKTVVDAMVLRARVVELFEMAEQARSDEQRRRLLSFVIVGGGVTGVEVAAEVVEMARETLLPRYSSVQESHLSMTVIEGGDRLVPTARVTHSAYIHRYLEQRGVVVRLNSPATRVEEKRVWLKDGSCVDGFTLVWTAGVRPPDVVRDLPLLHLGDGRVRVDERLRALRPDGQPREDVYVIGDCAAAERTPGQYHAALAQVAVYMGASVGKELVRRAQGRPPGPAHISNQGYIISLGKHSAAAEMLGLAFVGRLAWLAWAGAYLVKMVGFRKQLEVFLDHVTHMVFEHDISQIHARRGILSDEELNLSLQAAPPPRPAAAESEPASRA